ncbi:MAG: hypothetical protein ACRDQ4_16970 [Pseudonocardiaceae bacterium]
MIISLGIRGEPYPTAVGLTTAPPEWSVSPAGVLLVDGIAREDTARRLSDLLSGIPEDGCAASAHLADVTAARAAVARGDNPVLYRAYRDVLPPRAKHHAHCLTGSAGTDYWFADLVIYQGGELPGSRELARSIGHWNTAVQLEVFQCLSGRVLMLSSECDATGQLGLRYQVCGPGDVTVIPFGAWHLTVVLAGPAAVFNIYTDAHTLAHGRTSRDAAGHDRLKYHSRAGVKVVVIRRGDSIALTGDPAELLTYSPILRVSAPDWTRSLLEPEGLAAFYQHAADTALAQFLAQALTHAHEPQFNLSPPR